MHRILSRAQGRHALGVFLYASAVIILSACATRPPVSTLQEQEQRWQARQQVLSELQEWSFKGRLAVKDKVQDSWSASLRWQQDGDSYDIHLAGAFGHGAARLFGHEDYAVIETSRQAALTATSAEQLMQQQLGWSVPVQGLKYWLVGSPEPGTIEHHAIDEFGRLSELEQSGWQIRYRSYIDVGGIELPRKLELENTRLRARLVIDSWQIDAEEQA